MDLTYTNCQEITRQRLLFILHVVTNTSRKLPRMMVTLIIGVKSRDGIFEVESFAHLIGLWIYSNRIVKHMLPNNYNFPKKNLKNNFGSYGLS